MEYNTEQEELGAGGREVPQQLTALFILGKNLKRCHATVTNSFHSSLLPKGQLLILTGSHSSCDYFQSSDILLVCLSLLSNANQRLFYLK